MKQGLRPTTKDPRDYSLTKTLGAPVLDIPNTDWLVAEPLKIKDQGDTDYCTAYALTSVSEDQEGIELSPLYQFHKAKLIEGRWNEWGADLRSAAASAVKYGSIPEHEAPLADPRNRDIWPPELDDLALTYRKRAYFWIDGPYDFFDNIRATLWKYRGEKRTILAGSLWKTGWSKARKGVIPTRDSEVDFGGHAFKVLGQKIISGKPYLVVQNSYGEKKGDKGFYYFPREVVNREWARYGAVMFQDILPGEPVPIGSLLEILVFKLKRLLVTLQGK